MTHGASAYANHRCRCATCTAANTARVREYRKQQTNAVTSDRGVTTPGTTEKCPGVAGTTRGVAQEEQAS